MKFYITGRSSNYEKVEEAFAAVKARGHEASFEWTALPMVKPYRENSEKTTEFAQRAIKEGVIDADVYVIFPHQDGNGLFAELGAALAANVLSGKPTIYAIGERNLDWGMFYAHPAIVWKDSLEEVLAEVNGNRDEVKT